MSWFTISAGAVALGDACSFSASQGSLGGEILEMFVFVSTQKHRGFSAEKFVSSSVQNPQISKENFEV